VQAVPVLPTCEHGWAAHFQQKSLFRRKTFGSSAKTLASHTCQDVCNFEEKAQGACGFRCVGVVLGGGEHTDMDNFEQNEAKQDARTQVMPVPDSHQVVVGSRHPLLHALHKGASLHHRLRQLAGNIPVFSIVRHMSPCVCSSSKRTILSATQVWSNVTHGSLCFFLAYCSQPHTCPMQVFL